ncbi:MAG: ComEA family DNA-binding protein [Anaerolineales bacterium]|nr:ComEA family DNA-binding protein [Anaerolineales bacterium]
MKPKTFLSMLYGILIGLLAAAIIWTAARPPVGEAVTLLPTPTEQPVTVYITGAVATPGVYSLPQGSRIVDAVEAAGGFVAGAEEDRINLASALRDGMQIDVPGVPVTSRVSSERVNINTATVDELDTLPGIGPTAAQGIVDYRQENGPFQTILDIQNVPGVGPSTYDRIKDYITIGP